MDSSSERKAFGSYQQWNQGSDDRRIQKMKRPRNLTVAKRQHIEDMGLAAENGLISKKMSDEWLLVHRLTNQAKVVPAP